MKACTEDSPHIDLSSSSWWHHIQDLCYLEFLFYLFFVQRTSARDEMGALEYFSDLLAGTGSHKHTHKRRKQMQTVELKVRMDCEGCERKVKNSVSSMKGVQSVDINRKQQKVTVTGYVDPNKVLKKVKGTGKRAEFWPYVPYNLVYQPYAAQAYDKKAPAGYVRNVEYSGVVSNQNRADEEYTTLFSDDNPNACAIM